MKVFAALVLHAILLSATAAGQAQASALERYPVDVVSTGQDRVGQQLVFALRERIQASPLLRLSSGTEPLRLTLAIVTLSGEGPPGASTIYSAAWYFEGSDTLGTPVFVTASVGVAGSLRIYDEADALARHAYDIWSRGNADVTLIRDCKRVANRNEYLERLVDEVQRNTRPRRATPTSVRHDNR